MRYIIPGELKSEYRIFGPFTINQFGYLAAGGGFAWLFWKLPLPREMDILGGSLCLGVGVALGFLEVEGEKGTDWLKKLFRYWTNQRLFRYAFDKEQRKGATQDLLALQGFEGGILRAANRSGLVLQVQAINFDLKSDAEKEACLSGYREFLNSLSFPLQVVSLTQVKRLDDYLAYLGAVAEREEESGLGQYAKAQMRFVQGLLANRSILAHKHYLIIWGEKTQRGVPGGAETASRWLEERRIGVEKSLARLGLNPRPLEEDEMVEFLTEVWKGESNFKGRLYDYQALRVGGPIGKGGWESGGLKDGTINFQDLLAPDAMEVRPDCLRVGGRFARTLAVIGYPREVGSGWLDSLYAFPGDLRISTTIEPLDSRFAVHQLTEVIKYHQGAIMTDTRLGRVPDPYIQAALDDARDLRDQLARSQAKLFQYHLEVTIWAENMEELERQTQNLESELGSKLLLWRRCRYQQLEAFQSTLPTGESRVGRSRNMDTMSLSTTFPFVSGELTQEGGDIWGINRNNSSLVLLDRFSFISPHTVTVAASGAGKSYWVKYLLTQSRLRGDGGIILDASDREYRSWCLALGGVYVRLGVGSPDRINPLEISPPAAKRRPKNGKPLSQKAVYLRGLLQLLVKDLSAEEIALLDGAVFSLYRRYGFEDNWESFQEAHRGCVGNEGKEIYLRPRPRPMPTLGDLLEALRKEEKGRRMAALLEPFVSGSLSLFNGETNLDLDNEVVVFDVHEVVTGHPDLAAPSYFILTEFVWQRLQAGKKRRVVVIDEAHHLLRHGPTATFVEGLFRSSRKLGAGISLITQSIHDFLGSGESGGGRAAMACLANAPMTLLMKANNLEEVETMGGVFSLSQREKEFLANARRGEGLLIAGTQRVAMKVVVPPELHRLITTDPGEVARQEELEEAIEG